MSATNIVTASFGTSRSVSTRRLYQYDYGQILQIEGVDLPNTYTVHFANKLNSGDAIIQIGDATGVSIPDALLETGEYVYAWVFLHVGANDGETMYTATIPVNRRAQPTSDTPTPAQQNVIDTAIAALTSAVEQTGEDAASAFASATLAVESAERAEQAANTAGYLDVEINAAGHLIYTKTDAVDVDFSLSDGHLIMEVE